MRSDDLRVGMHVAVESRRYGLYSDPLGPYRAVVKQLDVYEDGAKRTKTVVTIVSRDTGAENGSRDLYLDGKNIFAPWADLDASYRQIKQDLEFAQRKTAIKVALEKEKLEKDSALVQKVWVLLSALGVATDIPDVSARYYSNYVNLRPGNHDFERLAQVLSDALQRQHTEGM